MSTLQQSDLKEDLHYCPDTGVFTWKVSRCNAKKGSVPTAKVGSGYPVISVRGQRFQQHRLAFLYMEGKLPSNHVDHINGVIDDNRWCNLREVTRVENSKNTKLRVDNTSGVPGVLYAKDKERWRARISIDRRVKHLGYYRDWFDAVCARKSAENKYNYHQNHGRV